MSELVLVLNAGSSSLKFAVFDTAVSEPWPVLARGQVEGIGTKPRMSARDGAGAEMAVHAPPSSIRDSRGALAHVADWLRATFSSAQVRGVGHRVVHGGARYSSPVRVTPAVIAELRKLVPLAPLHQPYNLAAIEAVAERLPQVPQVACFDTGFHRGQSAVAELVPLPEDIRRHGVQRYGFHGLSYEYIASVLPEVAPAIARRRVIVAHLGSGASLCALREGKSIDCSMSFTALDGLCMGTRPGSLDPGVVLYLFQTLELKPAEVETILYKKSGLLGVSGISNDMRDLLKSAEPAAKLAVDYFVYQATKQIGALAGVLGGIEGLVFTAGIGENSIEIRERILKACAWLGIELDAQANAGNAQRLSSAASAVSAWRIPTNEELMIARHTGQVLELKRTTPAAKH